MTHRERSTDLFSSRTGIRFGGRAKGASPRLLELRLMLVHQLQEVGARTDDLPEVESKLDK